MALEGKTRMDRGSESSERLLIEAAQCDPARFADLYEQNFDRVHAFIARRVRDRALTQDLTSEVFHTALSKIERFEWRGVPFAAWLFRIAANAIADHYQRQAREQGQEGGEIAIAPHNDADLADAERKARLYRFVNQLPHDQRRVVKMRFVEEKSIREIALILERSEGAVKQLQLRALQTLRGRMEGANG